MRLIFSFVVLLCISLPSIISSADERLDLGTLYKVTMLRADPGKLENLIEFFRAQKAEGYFKTIGETAPMIMRHSQGDHWDLFLLQPIQSYAAYFGTEIEDTRRQNTDRITQHKIEINNLTVYREELFAFGPAKADVERLFADNGLFHLELFAALAGKHDELLDQRVRENAYLMETKGMANLVFVGDMGADFDVFTIGFYPDLMAYAKPSPATDEEKLKAAVKNGFQSNNHIGFNLREFLAYHNDTLATKVSYDD